MTPSNFSASLLVTTLRPLVRSILFAMGLDQVVVDFLMCAGIGAATVLLVILCAGISIPGHAPVPVRRKLR